MQYQLRGSFPEVLRSQKDRILRKKIACKGVGFTEGKRGASFFGIEMSFLWYRGGLSLLFGIEILFLVSRFCTLLFGIETVN